MKRRIKSITANLIGFAVLFFGGLGEVRGQWTEPVPMEPNFGTAMTAVWISNDGLRLYLSAGLAAIGWTERDSIGGEWSQWTALPSHINASNTQTSMCESPSGDTLYFTSNSDERPDGGYGWMDIYYCVRTDTGWGPAVNAGPNVNDTGREWSVNISRDGSMLLVAGQMPGASSHNIYYCQLQTDGTWGPKISFGTNVNTWHDEEHPSLSPDNTRLFFSRVDAPDMWASELVDSIWADAVPLPYPINSAETEMNPCIANDGRTLWYRKGRLQSGYRIVTSVDTTAMGIGMPARTTQIGKNIRLLHASPSQIMFELIGLSSQSFVPILIHNILGQTVLSQSVGTMERRVSINLPQLSAGTYFLTVRIPKEDITAKFDIIQ